MKTLLHILLLSLLPSLTFAQAYYGKAKDIEQIKANTLAFSQAYMDGNLDKLLDSYTEDGKIFPGGKPILAGREDLRKHWELPPGVRILYHQVLPTEVRIIKKYAYDFGYYEGKTRGDDGQESSWRGKYVIVWRKVGKDWKIYLDIWNR